MRCIILGGTGFIGKHLCMALHRQGLAATVVSRQPDRAFLKQYAPTLDALPLDELEGPDVRRRLAETEVVIHLAHGSIPATGQGRPDQELDINVRPAIGTVSYIAEASRRRCHVVYVSSGGQIYGPGHQSPITETSAPCPTSSYALGKLLVEESLGYMARVGALDLTVLRVANPVGQWQVGARVGLLAASARAAAEGVPLKIFGEGRNMRDYFDVDDLAGLLAGFIPPTGRRSGVFNIGSGIGHDERAVIAAMEAASGRRLDLEWLPPRAFDLPYAVLDPSKAEQGLGWRTETSLAGLAARMWHVVGRA